MAEAGPDKESHMTIWDILIWGGSTLTIVGVVTLGWCILTVMRARRTSDESRPKTVMQRVIIVNMAALAASVFGLMFVIIGIMLGN